MVDPERLWEAFTSDWERREESVRGTATTSGYHIIRLLVEVLKELQAHRPVDLRVELEPVVTGPVIRDTETAHGNRLDLVKHIAIEELNVAPQVAEYARRILMGCRPEPDREVIESLWSYVGQEPPEGYTLVDKRAAALLELTQRATNDGVHPAAAELARRILTGEGPTVKVYNRVAVMVQRDGPMRPADLDGVEWCDVLDLNGPQTVLVVNGNVDLEPGDLGEEVDNEV